MITKTETSLILKNRAETVRIEAWGQGLRICAVPFGNIPDEPWALEQVEPKNVTIQLPTEENNQAYIENSGIRCTVSGRYLSFSKDGKLLFEVFKFLGVEDIAFNQPKGMMYKTENPFA